MNRAGRHYAIKINRSNDLTNNTLLNEEHIESKSRTNSEAQRSPSGASAAASASATRVHFNRVARTRRNRNPCRIFPQRAQERERERERSIDECEKVTWRMKFAADGHRPVSTLALALALDPAIRKLGPEERRSRWMPSHVRVPLAFVSRGSDAPDERGER